MKTKSSMVSIVVVTHNGSNVISECLESIKSLNWPEREIIVVDNASSDNTVELISKIIPTARTIRSPTNRGYGGGANIGSRAARGDILLFVNQDVHLDENFLDGIVERMTLDSTIGICGGIILSWDGTWLQSAGQVFERWSGYGLDYGFGSSDIGLRRETEEVFSPNGAVFAVSREAFTTIGGFDEDLFMYFDETDLAWRARLIGFRVFCCPSSVARHRISRERAYSPWPRYFIDRNSLLSATRNLELRNLIIFLPVALAIRMAGIFALALFRRNQHAKSMGKAVRDFFVYSSLAWKKRRESQTHRRVGDRQVMTRQVLASPADIFRSFAASLIPSTSVRAAN